MIRKMKKEIYVRFCRINSDTRVACNIIRREDSHEDHDSCRRRLNTGERVQYKKKRIIFKLWLLSKLYIDFVI